MYKTSKGIANEKSITKNGDIVLHERERSTAKISKNRNPYINEALEFYKLLQKRKMISRQLKKESKIVQEESMKVLAEFEKLQCDY